MVISHLVFKGFYFLMYSLQILQRSELMVFQMCYSVSITQYDFYYLFRVFTIKNEISLSYYLNTPFFHPTSVTFSFSFSHRNIKNI